MSQETLIPGPRRSDTVTWPPLPVTRQRRPARPRRRWLMRLLALALATVAAGLLAETSVRAFVGEQPKFPRHVVEAPWGLRVNQPGAVYRHKSADVKVWFRINAQGMRADRDYPYAKPPGVLRILSLGDSYTIGYEVAQEACFSSVLERELRARGLAVEVLNCGVSGFSSAEECLYLERELLRYDPDLVLVSYYPNDLTDNIRAGLFGLEDGRLVEQARRYVPGGRLGNLLNHSWLLSRLSERSDAFALLKERLTHLLKREMVAAGQREVRAAAAAAAGGPQPRSAEREYQQRLALAIYERIYAGLRARGIPLLVQSIPLRLPDDTLVEEFPPGFDFDRPGLAFLSAKPFLDPLVGKHDLYYRRSHWHWTPISHRLSGEHLARRILERRLLPGR